MIGRENELGNAAGGGTGPGETISLKCGLTLEQAQGAPVQLPPGKRPLAGSAGNRGAGPLPSPTVNALIRPYIVLPPIGRSAGP